MYKKASDWLASSARGGVMRVKRKLVSSSYAVLRGKGKFHNVSCILLMALTWLVLSPIGELVDVREFKRDCTVKIIYYTVKRP